MDSESKLTQRLPDYIVPSHYDLEIIPDPSHEKYKGKVVITIDVRKSTDIILIHGVDLNVNEISCTHTDKVLVPTKLESDRKLGKIKFVFDSAIPIGISRLQIGFDNKLNYVAKGFYRTDYLDNENNKHECLATHFEPDYACCVFPCFDEPAFKATFRLNIKYLPNKTVLSNTPLEKIEESGTNIVNYQFKTTPKMSTYLLAFALGDFGSISKVGSSGITFTCYAPINNVHQMECSLKACEEFVNFYQRFFDVRYPLDKLDLLAIPDFMYGGMENWGLIICKENYVLIDSKVTSTLTIKGMSLGLAHEIAHQWFGNLVTMDWWTNIWLNEGFANWIQFLSVDKVFPEYDIWRTFITREYCDALEVDSHFHSHPIEIEATHPSDLIQMFDYITYRKGTSVIQMMSYFVGIEALQRGLHDYMVKYQYSNVSSQNLWDCLGQASNKPVSKLMQTFTRQTGYPAIMVTPATELTQAASLTTLKISQKRFLLDSSLEVPKQLWLIPIRIYCAYKNGTSKYETILEEQSLNVDISERKGLDYILINKKRIGFYRVYYAEPLYSLLISNLSELHMEDRVGLLIDYYSFARSGLAGTDQYLDLIVKFSEVGETDDHVWMMIVKSLREIYSLMFYSTEFEKFSKHFGVFCVKIMSPILKRYTVTPEKSEYDESLINLISLLMSTLIPYDHATKATLLTWFDEYVEGRLKILPDLRICMFKACYTSETYFQKLLKYFMSTKIVEEKIDIMYASSSATNVSIIARMFDLSISSEVRPDDSREIYFYICTSPYSHNIGWEFVKANYNKIHEFFFSPLILTRILSSVVSGFATMKKYNESLEYFTSNPSIDLNQSLYMGLEAIKIRSNWLDRDERKILDWFERAAK